MIELEKVCKKYVTRRGEVTALSDIDLTIPGGSVFGVIGLSGAGKSTLVRCINLLEPPTSGRVFIDGEDLTAVSGKRLREIRRGIGMIFQGFHLLEQRTAEGNILFPLEVAGTPRKEARRRAAELLELVGLSDRANSYPSMLSGGQKQRVAIARALATRPAYLLCDEATSALDPNTTSAILSLLKEINRTLGVTVVVVTHEMRVVEEICSDVAVLDGGKIAESGKVADVFSFPRSKIAEELIIPDLIRSMKSDGARKLRLVFNGETSGAPVISGLALECGVRSNILYADTRNIDGKMFGHMVLSLPQGEEEFRLVKDYLNQYHVVYKEET